MSTPAPHVPVNFLLAGGAQVFSADCVSAFLACNINPEWIGSYGALVQRQEAARNAVQAHESMLRTGQRAPGAREGSPPVPTFEQRWMAASTAGHLGPDASHRREPSVRGDNCATNVDGYTERGAPSMLTMGSSTSPGTVEYDVSQQEQALARQRRSETPGSTAYPAAARRADQDRLIDTAVDSHRRHFPEGLRNAPVGEGVNSPASDVSVRNDRAAATNRARGQAAGSTATVGAVPPAGSAATAASTDPNSVPLIDSTNKTAPASDQAKECLKAYRDAMETPQARQEAINQEIARQQARPWGNAEQTAHATREQELRQNVADANQRAARARNDETAAWDAATTPQLNRMPPGPARDRVERQRREAAEEATRSRQAAEQSLAEQQRLLQQHQQSTPSAQVRCLQAQSARIAAGNPNTTGSIPPLQGP